MPVDKQHRRPPIDIPEIIDHRRAWAYFDGASNAAGCGGGAILYLNDHHFYHIRMGLGPGSNNYAELNCLRLLLTFAQDIHCNAIQIFGDSLLVINWFNNLALCHSHTLSALLREVHYLKGLFDSISVTHIYRSRNNMADILSKEVAELDWGTWHFTEHLGEQVYRFFHRPFIEEAHL